MEKNISDRRLYERTAFTEEVMPDGETFFISCSGGENAQETSEKKEHEKIFSINFHSVFSVLTNRRE